MAALFNRNLGYRIQSQTIVNRDQLRTLPAIFTIPSPPANISDSTDGDASGVLRNVYDNSLNSWLYRVRFIFFCRQTFTFLFSRRLFRNGLHL